MTIRLARLPDRKPVKLSIAVMPHLHQRLQDYAAAYAETYGSSEELAELVPAMLSAFLDSDRDFVRRRKRSGTS